MERRNFCLSLATLPALVVMPHLSAPRIDAPSFDTLPDVIHALEEYAQARPYSWTIHNELRHQYWFLSVSEAMSRKHADILLAHSVMDSYILHTLSDWHLTEHHGVSNPNHGIAALLDNANRYAFLPHLRAACLIKIGDVYQENAMLTEAAQFFSIYTSSRAAEFGTVSTLAPYHALADARLSAYQV